MMENILINVFVALTFILAHRHCKELVLPVMENMPPASVRVRIVPVPVVRLPVHLLVLGEGQRNIHLANLALLLVQVALPVLRKTVILAEKMKS